MGGSGRRALRGRLPAGGGGVVARAAQADPPPAARPLDGVHVRLHQQDAAPVQALEVLLRRRVRHAVALEAWALVLDLDLGLLLGDRRLDLDLLPPVELVAVL